MKKIKNFPISFFSVVMGLVGLTIATQKMVEIFKIAYIIPVFFLYLSLLVFVVLLVFYLLKIFLYTKEVKKELNHPIKINFLPTFSIGLLLFSVAFLSVDLFVSSCFWWLGMILHFIFSLVIIGAWMHHDKFHVDYMNPSWFIPAVGNILVPVAGVAHFNPELSWFFFSFGLFFWIVLSVIFFNRIFFHQPIAEKMLPTLFILIAPPAVAFISYFKLVGVIDSFSKIFYYLAVFFTSLLFSQIFIFKKIKRFYLSWWAYSFPLAAISIATVLMYNESGVIFYEKMFLILLLFLFSLIVLLFIKTLKAIFRGVICVEEN
jgi:tellurite resistance protein